MDVSELRKNAKVQLDGHPYVVVEFLFVKPGKGQGLYKCKLKNMITGAVLDRTWRSGEKFDPANVESRKMQYLFKDQNGFTFMDNESYEQVALADEIVGDDSAFLLDQISVDVLFYNDRPVGVTLPSHIVMTITECEPGVKGDTATNATKSATVETGHKIQVPLFIREGDKVKIDTRTGAYVERINT
ncbi:MULTISPECIES: elongation factor P [Nannocystis]|jgi:elongation factor P|uniref:Elongation factor P n=3 Tax=Nannocystis TaxID=53 RepID=A0ABS7TQ19_9BACT|nr:MULTISPECIES: elongation factor P [Nannocystis]MBZ5710316.1 elongation factor P [Nannocystis pusilla]MCY1005592.1 elongation factor P [Nannocystis pusilla]MCY1057842.1 elongation factor P [Nannocystis sp. SCPEA4]MDC0674812.1 elongation factor P [Nannocystis radixulma]